MSSRILNQSLSSQCGKIKTVHSIVRREHLNGRIALFMKRNFRYRPVSSCAALIFLLCWCAYFLTYLGRLNYTALMVEIIRTGILSQSQAGALGTAFFFCYALGQLLSGWLGKYFSSTQIIFCGLFSSGLINLCMGMFPGFLLMLLLWAFNGIVQSLIWPQLIQIFSSWFCGAAQMRACVYINTTVPLGTFAAYGFASWGVQNDVWVSCFFLPGWILCAFSVVWLTTMRFWERTTERTEIAVQSMQTQKISRPLFSGVTNSVLLLCFAMMVQGMLKDGLTNWTPVFLEGSFGISSASAILISTLIPAFNLVGACLSNIAVQSKFGIFRCGFLLFAGSGGAILALLLFGNKNFLISTGLISCITTAMIIVNTLFISVYPCRYQTPENAAAVSAMLNFSTYLGSAISTYVVGVLLTYFSWAIVFFLWLMFSCAATILLMKCCNTNFAHSCTSTK